MVGVVHWNAAAMSATLANLMELARVDGDVPQHRRVLLPQAVAEAARQPRDADQAAGVAVRLTDLPDVEVPAAAVELTTTNYRSNTIKYADRTNPDR